MADPDTTVVSLYRQNPGDLNPASLREALACLAPLLSAELTRFGQMKPTAWQRIIDTTHIDLGRAACPVTLENLVDFR